MKPLKSLTILKEQLDQLPEEQYNLYLEYNKFCAQAAIAVNNDPTDLIKRENLISSFEECLKFLDTLALDEADHIRLLKAQAEAELAYVRVLHATGYTELLNQYTNEFPLIYDEAVEVEALSREVAEKVEKKEKKDPNPNMH